MDPMGEDRKVDVKQSFELTGANFLNKKSHSKGEVFLIFDALTKNERNRFQSSFSYVWTHEIKKNESQFEIDISLSEFVLFNNINGVLEKYDLSAVLNGEKLKLISDGKSILSVEGSEAIVSKLLNELSVQQGVQFANFFLPTNLQKTLWPLFEQYFLQKDEQHWYLHKRLQNGSDIGTVIYENKGWVNKSGKIVTKLETDMEFPGNRKIKTSYRTKYQSKIYYDEAFMPALSESYYMHQDDNDKEIKKTTTIRTIVMSSLAK